MNSNYNNQINLLLKDLNINKQFNIKNNRKNQ